MMRIDANSWYYSPEHGELCRVIETQTLWGETTCLQWLKQQLLKKPQTFQEIHPREQLRDIIQSELASGQSTDDNGQLVTRAKNRWYVPDPNKAGDLEKLREKALLKEFEDYRTSSQKRLKVFRLEAVRAGFKKAWQERDYATIITVASKIPENVLKEDPSSSCGTTRR